MSPQVYVRRLYRAYDIQGLVVDGSVREGLPVCPFSCCVCLSRFTADPLYAPQGVSVGYGYLRSRFSFVALPSTYTDATTHVTDDVAASESFLDLQVVCVCYVIRG